MTMTNEDHDLFLDKAIAAAELAEEKDNDLQESKADDELMLETKTMDSKPVEEEQKESEPEPEPEQPKESNRKHHQTKAGHVISVV